MAPPSKRRDEPGDDEEHGPESCSLELLDFASRAQVLIAELLLLSDRIPPEFLDRSFDPILFDLRYFDDPDEYEAGISGFRDLEMLEDELHDSCHSFLERFFSLSIGMITYHQELVKFLEELQESEYLQNTLDKILVSQWDRKLLVESLALFGCMLLLMEHRFTGFLREKLLVAHVRHTRLFDEPKLVSLCLLCRVYTPLLQHPKDHLVAQKANMISVQKPEELLARFPLPKFVLENVIYRLKDDDIYNHIQHYPDSQHRTAAMSLQAGNLYVLLLFYPQLLQDESVMREIIDRFYKDCWVVPVFLYFFVDLFVSWEAYKEAKSVLSLYHSPTFVRDRSQLHCSKINDFLLEFSLVLTDGTITNDYVFQNSQHLIALIRACNVSLRWLILHKSSVDKKLKEIVNAMTAKYLVDDERLLVLIFKASQIEYEVKHHCSTLLQTKDTLLHDSKCRALNCIKKASEHNLDSLASTCVIDNQTLKEVFTKMHSEVYGIDYARNGSTRKIDRVVSKLKDVEKLYQVEGNSQMKQSISEIQNCLLHMCKVLGFSIETMSAVSVITEAVYAWHFVVESTTVLNKKIEQDSSLVLNLHTFYLKFQSLLEAPVSWISLNERYNRDNPIISNYYAALYMEPIYAIFDTIPALIFKILSEDNLQTSRLCDHSTRVEKLNLQHIMKLDSQLNFTRVANMISNFSQGMHFMEKTVQRLPDTRLRQRLEENTKKELARLLNFKVKSLFQSPCDTLAKLEETLQTLETYFLSKMHAIRCCQDILHFQSCCIWEEVMDSILLQSILQEADISMSEQGSTSKAFESTDSSNAHSFLGSLLHKLVCMSNPSQSMYIESMSGWFNVEGVEQLGLHTFLLIEKCIGPAGMLAMDSLFKLLIVKNLEQSCEELGFLSEQCKDVLCSLDGSLGTFASLPLLGCSIYKHLENLIDGRWNSWIERMAFVGQLQLLRCMVSRKSTSITKNMKSNGSEELDILTRFSSLQRKYISKDPPPLIGKCIFAVSISQFCRYIYDSHLGLLTSRAKTVTLDFSPLAIGLGTLLRQFHPSCIMEYVQFMGQYVRTSAAATRSNGDDSLKGNSEPTSQALKAAIWLTFFSKYMKIPKDFLDSVLPSALYAVVQF